MESRSSSSGIEDLLREGARDLNLQLASEQTAAFRLYAKELLRWNRRMNLTGLKEEAEVAIHHFLASLAFTAAFSHERPLRVADIGSGAGFPGLPLKIACPHLRVALVEASRKKISFLRHICFLLRLEGVEPLRARAEELAMDPSCQGTFDLCLARAVGGRESLLSAVASLLQPGGRLITSGREQERGPWPETESFAFEEKRKVALPSVGLERSLLIWQRRK